MGASYSVENGTLRTTDAASTAMGCEGGLGKQEEWVFALITSGPTLALDGNELTLTKGDLVGTFLDIEAAQPDLTLGNRVWTLTTIVDSDIASSVPDGVVASLEWKEDGGVIVSTGCNTGLARPTVTGNEIEFGPIGLTKKACPGAADQVERAVMTVLSAGSVTYEIQSNTLILRAGDRGLDLTAPA
jgi:heat shock protein HslJ